MGFPIQDNLKINDQVRKDMTANLKTWNNLSVSQRGSRPKQEGNISQQLVCMCMRIHYFNRLDGHVCLKCAIFCKKSIKQDNLDRPMFDGKLNYICDVCECNCSVLYYRHDRKEVGNSIKDRVCFENKHDKTVKNICDCGSKGIYCR